MREWTPLEGLCPKEIPYRGGRLPPSPRPFPWKQEIFQKGWHRTQTSSVPILFFFHPTSLIRYYFSDAKKPMSRMWKFN